MTAFGGFYRDKTVLVTGHTGFKGSWLCSWLHLLGARVIGYSLEPPSEPSHFEAVRLASRIVDLRADVREHTALQEAFARYHPDMVFHLAAQPLVRKSFEQPRLTFETNFMGTVNVLDVARFHPSVQAVVCITSDKCYENQEWTWGYRETDKLGGHEPYGASKACAELAIAVFQDPRFQARANPERQRGLPIGAARAGNVIGGGDWARDRLIPDVVRAIAAGRDVVIRSPDSTRPWQHVVEAVSGYLWLGTCLVKDPKKYIAAYNFGPATTARAVPVVEVVRAMLSRWPGARSRLVIQADCSGAESGLLRLDCSRAEALLCWRANWDMDQTLDRIVTWYHAFYQDSGADLFSLSASQIEQYTASAKEKQLVWATS